MNSSLFAFEAISRPGRREWVAIAIFAALAVLLLPVVLWKTVGLGQGDVQVFFRAGWALWTGYPLYEVTDHHGWTFHYPPTFALFMAPFANPLPDYPQPVWALPPSYICAHRFENRHMPCPSCQSTLIKPPRRPRTSIHEHAKMGARYKLDARHHFWMGSLHSNPAPAN
jgi:hypothetical protein